MRYGIFVFLDTTIFTFNIQFLLIIIILIYLLMLRLSLKHRHSYGLEVPLSGEPPTRRQRGDARLAARCRVGARRRLSPATEHPHASVCQ